MKIGKRINLALLNILGGVPAKTLEDVREMAETQCKSMANLNATYLKEHQSMCATLSEVAHELEQVSNEHHVFKRTFARLVTGKPVMFVLPMEAALVSGDYVVRNGALVRIDSNLVGQAVGPNGVYVRTF